MQSLAEAMGANAETVPLCVESLWDMPSTLDDGKRRVQLVIIALAIKERDITEEAAVDILSRWWPGNAPLAKSEVTRVYASDQQLSCNLLREKFPDLCDRDGCDYPRWKNCVDDPRPGVIEEEDLAAMPRAENPRLDVHLEADNLLSQYVEYASSMSDAYQEYHYAAALFMVSTAIERRVVLKLRQGKIHPNLWIFILGDSTISRKTTALKEPTAILETYDYQRRLPSSFSPEALIEAMADCPRAYLIKDEAGSLLAAMGKSYMEETRDLFSELYDGGDYYRKLRTSQRKENREFRISKPYVTQLLATTPDNFRAYTSILDLTSGWLLRYVYFHPNYPKPWRAFEAATDDDFSRYMAVSGMFTDLREKLASLELEALALIIPHEGWELFAKWQRSIEEEAMRGDDNVFKAVAGRLMTVALKLAIVFTVASKAFDTDTTREISLDHVREACRQVQVYFLPMAKTVVEDVARSERENLQNLIIGTIKRAGGKLERSALLRKLHVKLKDVGEAVEALQASGEVEEVIVQGKTRTRTVYRLVPDNHNNNLKDTNDLNDLNNLTNTDNPSLADCDKSACIGETIGTTATIAAIATIETKALKTPESDPSLDRDNFIKSHVAFSLASRELAERGPFTALALAGKAGIGVTPGDALRFLKAAEGVGLASVDRDVWIWQDAPPDQLENTGVTA